MSLDYPFYEELCRRRHRAAKWWRIGDVLYYLGLLPALLAAASVPVTIVAGLLGAGWRFLQSSMIILVGGAVILYVGASLKRYSYNLAKRDGIDGADY